MNQEKIREVALRVGKQMQNEPLHDGADDDDIPVEFLTRCLKELSKDVEPVAYYDCQERGFYWAKPTSINAPVTVKVEPVPLY